MMVNNLANRRKKRGNVIKSLMVKEGIKQVDISNACAVSPAFVSEVVSGRKKSARVRQAIADALGIPVTDLWPNGKRVA